MSRIYIHSKGYIRHNRWLIGLAAVCVLVILGLAGSRAYSQYQKLNQSPQSQINNPSQPLIGYITPYFMFKDTSKWAQDKADSTASKIIFYQYQNGQMARELDVYVNNLPAWTQLAATRVLPVQVAGDSLSAGSLSAACARRLPAGQSAVDKITLDGTTMPCDSSQSIYSVILARAGGDYQLKMVGSKIPETFAVVYKDYTSQPSADTIINLANSFKAV